VSNDQVSKAAEWGYDAPDQSNQGKYLTLKKAGDKARIRIVSRPLKFSQVQTFEGKSKEAFYRAFIVIHKEIVDGKPMKTVKGFKAGPMIYGLIYNYVVSKDWGDPTHYDLEITRTEVKGSFYTVTPIPKPIGPISAAEQKMVEEAAIDLEALFLGKDDDEEGAPSPSDDEDPFADE
jgi:hypothetical protein